MPETGNSPAFVKTLYGKTHQKIGGFLLENERFCPLILLLLLFSAFILVKPLPSVAPVLLFFFLPGFILLRFVLGNSLLTSTIFSMPLSIAASSIFFRIALLFSQSQAAGWLFVAIGWSVACLLGWMIRKYDTEKIELAQTEEEKKVYWIVFFVLSASAIIIYGLIAGPPSQDKIFWWSHDANWQIATLTYLDNNPFELQAYLCAGQHGYELDSYASTNSLIPVYMVMKLSGLPPGASQQIFLTLAFLLMVQGVFVLYSKIFRLESGLFSPLFIIMPLSTFFYLGDIYGLWRVSEFNAFFPWAFLFGLFWMNSFGALIPRAALLAFTMAVYPFSSILLLPSYAAGFLRNATKRVLLMQLPVYVFALSFLYFTFFQATFQTHAGQIDSFTIGVDNMPKIEKELLARSLNLSISNIDWVLGALFLICFGWLGYLCTKETKPLTSGISALFLTLCIGLLLSSGLIYVNDRMARYEMAMRYTIVFSLFLPLLSIFLANLAKARLYMGLAILMPLLLVSAMNVATFQQALPTGNTLSDAREDVMKWFQKNGLPSDVVMFFDSPPSFGFNSIHHLQMRFSKFPPDNLTNLSPSALVQAEETQCVHRRYGLLDVRNETPQVDKALPAYIILRYRPISSGVAPQDVLAEPLILRAGYFEVHSNSVFRIYKKGTNSQ